MLRCLAALAVSATVSVAISRIGQRSIHSMTVNPVTPLFDHPTWLDACKEIYLDVGSNIGVQVRKLYEPEKYPEAKVLHVFDEVFGIADERKQSAGINGLCALGFEPNPKHYARLAELERAYLARGWHVHFYPYAAWSEEGRMEFTTEIPQRSAPGDTTDLGAHLRAGDRVHRDVAAGSVMQVRTVDLAAFLRTLPPHSVQLMKMDIEGAEYETLAQLLRTGWLCDDYIREAFVEVHAWGEVTHWGMASDFKRAHPRSFGAIQERLQQLADSRKCPSSVTKVSELDDESYLHDVDSNFSGSHR